MFSRAHVCAAAIEYGAYVIDFGIHPYQHALPEINRVFYAVYPELASRSCGYSVSEPAFVARKLFKFIKPAFISGKIIRKIGYRGYITNGRLDDDTFCEINSSSPFLILDGFKLLATNFVYKHKNKIRNIFKIDSNIVAVSQSQLMSLGEVGKPKVAVHIRQTDFATAAGGRYFFTPEEYLQICERIKRSEMDVEFVIFTDGDREVMASVFHQLGGHIFRGETLFHELSAMSLCDYILGPINSTFSRWASFLNNKPWLGVEKSLIQNREKKLAFSDFANEMIPWKGQ